MDYSFITSSIAFAFGSFFAMDLPPPSIKFVCSYGGKILPCRLDGKLRYVGGHTRVLTVRRGISFSGLQAKLRELCGWKSVSLRCQLPTEDMGALVSITSSEDLDNLVEYYCVSYGHERTVKVRAFLFRHPGPITANPAPTTHLISVACTVCRTQRLAPPVKFHCRYEKPSAAVATREAGAYIRWLHGRRRGTLKLCNYLAHRRWDSGISNPTLGWLLLREEAVRVKRERKELIHDVNRI